MTERKINYPQADIPDIRRVVTVAEGGFGGSNLRESAAALGVLVESEKGQTIVSTADLSDSNLKITGPDFSKPILKGPTYVVAGFPYRYDLVNPLMTGNVVAVDRGTAAFVGATISGTAPSEPGVLVMTVNGREVHIPVKAPKPMAPVLSCISDGRTTMSYNLPLAVDQLKTIGYSDSLKEVEYQVSEVSGFDRILRSVVDTSKSINSQIPLLERGRTVYIRARVSGMIGEKSDWSNTVKVTVETKVYPLVKIAQKQLTYQTQAGYAVMIGSEFVSCTHKLNTLYYFSYNKYSLGTDGKLNVIEKQVAIGDATIKHFGGLLAASNYGFCIWALTADGVEGPTKTGLIDLNESSANYGKIIQSFDNVSTTNKSTKVSVSRSGRTFVHENYRLSNSTNGGCNIASLNPVTGVMSIVNKLDASSFAADRWIWSHYLRPDGLVLIIFLNLHNTNNGVAQFYDRASESDAFVKRNEVTLGRMTDYPQAIASSTDGNLLVAGFMRSASAVSETGAVLWKIGVSNNVYTLTYVDQIVAGNYANYSYPITLGARYQTVASSSSPLFGRNYATTPAGFRDLSQTEADAMALSKIVVFGDNDEIRYQIIPSADGGRVEVFI